MDSREQFEAWLTMQNKERLSRWFPAYNGSDASMLMDAWQASREAMNYTNAELVAALEGLLCASGSHSCSTLHHSKADQHKHDEPCKPRIRYELSLDNARAALAKHRVE